MKTKSRINLLSNIQLDQLYTRPNFTQQEIECFFALESNDYNYLRKYRTLKNKIYFIIQLGYFRAKQQLYDFNLEEISQEVTYITNTYFNNADSIRNLVGKPYREIIKSQQNEILALYQYKRWSNNLFIDTSEHLVDLLKYYPKPDVATIELLKYFNQQKIIIPSYRTLQDIFSKALSQHELKLNRILLTIPDNIKSQLNKLIGHENFHEDEIILLLNNLRYDQKNFKYTALKLEIQKVEKISPLYQFSKLFLPTLAISKNSICHYADLTSNYPTSSLKKLRNNQQYLYVLKTSA